MQRARAIVPSPSGKLLYLSKRTRQDIQTSVAFLCTRVREPDTDDYKKLTKVMQYIRNTKDIILMIEPDDEAKWWVDRLYAVHPDMKSHTGIYIMLGKGYMYMVMKTKTKYQKLKGGRISGCGRRNGPSTMDKAFLAAQGQHVPMTTIYQDNKSTILLAENGKSSSSKRTRHINVWYFFVADKVKKVKSKWPSALQ